MKRTIKTFLIAIIGLMAYSSAEAQQKIGYVQFDSLIVMMPEWDTAQLAIKAKSDEYQKDLESQYQEEQKLRKKYEDATKDPNMTPMLLELHASRIQEMQRSIQVSEQTYRQALSNYQNKLINEIAEKVKVAVEAVAKEKGYTHVLDKSAFVFSSPQDDLMKAAKAKLGLK